MGRPPRIYKRRGRVRVAVKVIAPPDASVGEESKRWRGLSHFVGRFGAPYTPQCGAFRGVAGARTGETPYIQRPSFRRGNCDSSLWANLKEALKKRGTWLPIEGGGFLCARRSLFSCPALQLLPTIDPQRFITGRAAAKEKQGDYREHSRTAAAHFFYEHGWPMSKSWQVVANSVGRFGTPRASNLRGVSGHPPRQNRRNTLHSTPSVRRGNCTCILQCVGCSRPSGIRLRNMTNLPLGLPHFHPLCAESTYNVFADLSFDSP